MAPNQNQQNQNQQKPNQRMQSVKAECDKAPAGAKRDEAQQHYQAAEQSHAQNNEADTNRHLDSATNALK